MRTKELPYGTIEEILVVEREGSSPPPEVRADLEVQVQWVAQAKCCRLKYPGGSLWIQGADPSENRRLEDFCTRNPPRVVWVLDRDNAAKPVRLRLQMHLFPIGRTLPELELAVDEPLVAKVRKIKANLRDVPQLVQWLREQCLLPELEGEPDGVRIVASGGSEGPNDESWMVHGKTIRVSVKRVPHPQRKGEDVLLVQKVTRGRAGSSKHPQALLQGKISFVDISRTTRLRTESQAELAALASAGEGFLVVWKRFGEMEAEGILRRVASVGALQFEQIEVLDDDCIRFDLAQAENLNDRLVHLQKDDELEATVEIPLVVSSGALTWAALQEAEGARQKSGDKEENFIGKVVRRIRGEDSVILRLVGDSPMPPRKGYLSLSILGDRKRLQRRQEAADKIQAATCAWPQLGRFIEGLPLEASYPTERPALNPRTEKKVFPKHRPTVSQEDAIRAALNTPDIVLVQGPPGTGKTTVIEAIVERLHEELDPGRGLKGRILVSSFQHDAVENALAKLTINDLPSIKWGQKKDGARTPVGELAQSWCDDRLQTLKAHPGGATRPKHHRTLARIAESYLLSPGTPQETVRMLERVSEEVAGRVPGALLDELAAMIRELHHEAWEMSHSDPTKEAQRRAVRALRTCAASFGDDGPRNAGVLLGLTTGSDLLSADDTRLLQAAMQTVPAESGPLLPKLALLRHRLLLRLAPRHYTGGSVAGARKDVLDLMNRLRDEVERSFRASQSGVDGVVSTWMDALAQDVGAVEEALLAYQEVYGATCQQADSKGLWKLKGTNSYDAVLVDEAARANPLDLFIPMAMSARLILVGDQNQLPHVVDQELERDIDQAAESGDDIAKRLQQYQKTSLFAWLWEKALAQEERDGFCRTITLTDQFRMHEVLGDFISREFYEPKVKIRSPLGSRHDLFHQALPSVEGKVAAWVQVPIRSERNTKADPPPPAPPSWAPWWTDSRPAKLQSPQVSARQPEGEDPEIPGQSKSRPGEARVLVGWLKRFLDEAPEGFTFGVITFYSKQVGEILRTMHQVGLATPLERGGYEVIPAFRDRIRVGTVDAFQGRDFDVVFLSMVRSNFLPERTERERQTRYGHLMLANRLNVAMSRQKRLLVVVGDPGMLSTKMAEASIGPLVRFHQLCAKGGEHGVLL